MIDFSYGGSPSQPHSLHVEANGRVYMTESRVAFGIFIQTLGIMQEMTTLAWRWTDVASNSIWKVCQRLLKKTVKRLLKGLWKAFKRPLRSLWTTLNKSFEGLKKAFEKGGNIFTLQSIPSRHVPQMYKNTPPQKIAWETYETYVLRVSPLTLKSNNVTWNNLHKPWSLKRMAKAHGQDPAPYPPFKESFLGFRPIRPYTIPDIEWGMWDVTFSCLILCHVGKYLTNDVK